MKYAKNYSLKAHNTFGMDVVCDAFIQIDNSDEIPDIISNYLKNGKFYILSGGSNTLFTGDFHGTILRPGMSGIEKIEETSDEVVLRVAAGETWDNFIDYCVSNSYYGLENLTAIPGLVGSAPVQNIGAYGVEVRDTILKVCGYNLTLGLPFDFDNSACRFGYRNSLFKMNPRRDLLITDVYFQLSKKEHYTLTYKGLYNKLKEEHISLSINNISNTVRAIRDAKLPDYKKIGNGGSFFKNPVVDKERCAELLQKYPDLVTFDTDEGGKKLSAGQLIEKSGWKGKRVGDTGVYPKQALVLVNYGNATPKNILDLADSIISDVKSMFGVDLVMEINMV